MEWQLCKMFPLRETGWRAHVTSLYIPSCNTLWICNYFKIIFKSGYTSFLKKLYTRPIKYHIPKKQGMYTITESTQNIICLVFFFWRNKEGRNHTSVKMVSESIMAHIGHDHWIIPAASAPKGQAWWPAHKGGTDAPFNLTRLVNKNQESNDRF